jgi:transcriptional regulator with XRE-family HTH domain
MEGIKMNKTAEIFISRLGKMIKEKGLTQRELASKVGVTEVSMSRYIKGERVPSGPIVVNIAKELGISVDYLVGTSSMKKRQTNADRIRNMSDEELAEFLAVHDLALNGNDLPMLTDWFEWLQSEAE